MHQNANAPKWGAAVLAPLGAIGSAAPRLASAAEGRGVSDHSCRFLQTLAEFKSLHGPHLRRRPCPPKSCGRSFSAFFRSEPQFLQIFCRSKLHQKSDPSKTHPKSQKSDPMAPKARFWSHFCTLFSPLFAAFSQNINFLQTCIFPRQGTIFKVLAPPFFIKNPFKNHVFSRCLPGPHFFCLIC